MKCIARRRRWCSDEVHMVECENALWIRKIREHNDQRLYTTRERNFTRIQQNLSIGHGHVRFKYAPNFFTNYKSWTPFLLSVEILFYFLWQLPPHRSLKSALRYVHIYIYSFFSLSLIFLSHSLLFSW